MLSEKEIEVLENEYIPDNSGISGFSGLDLVYYIKEYNLDPNKLEEYQDFIADSMDSCEFCGWSYHIDCLDTNFEGEVYCWHCESEAIIEDEEDDTDK